MAALNTRKQKELATAIREIVCEEITSTLDLELKLINESLALLTFEVDTFSTKVECMETAANVTEWRLHDLDTVGAKLGKIYLLKRKQKHSKIIPVNSMCGSQDLKLLWKRASQLPL